MVAFTNRAEMQHSRPVLSMATPDEVDGVDDIIDQTVVLAESIIFPENFQLSEARNGVLSARCRARRNESQHGWPSFESWEELKANKPWATYFSLVYGKVPQTGYPICTHDLAFLHSSLIADAGVETPLEENGCSKDLPLGDCDVSLGIGEDGQAVRCLQAGTLFIVKPFIGLATFSAYNYLPVPNNTWVEIVHKATRGERGFWMYRATGSGIWYNTGNTKVYKNHHDRPSVGIWSHRSTMQAQNVTSLQYLQHGDRACGANFGATAEAMASQQRGVKLGHNWAIEIVDIGLEGGFACGSEASNGVFRAGWDAARECTCRNDYNPSSNAQVLINCARDSGATDLSLLLQGASRSWFPIVSM